ncbi:MULTISPECIES: EpsG family protein [unclassified Thioalkalivibrio]|uniref:EpsG family protein n=1 Tax=unclassified Thioalkalivibrio TaxID=2621013 RepID=UPI00036BECD0|nr:MULTISPECIES: EpsG family protein [unclassified Thioalkalivibrio]
METKTDGVAAILAFVSAAVLASLPIDQFPDRANYLAYADWRSPELIERYLSDSLLTLLLNEPLWLYGNWFLSTFLPPEAIVRTLIFFPSFVVYFLAFRANPRYAVVFLFLSIYPIFLTNHVHHLRFGLALSVFLVALHTAGSGRRLAFLMVAPFIHVGFFLFVGIYIFVRMVNRFRERRILLVGGIAGGALLMIAALGHLDGGVARQVERYQGEVDVGGGLFAVMGVILLILLSEGRAFVRRHALAIGFLALYLGAYWVFPYSRRFLDAGIWFVLIAGLSLSLYRRLGFISIYGGLTTEFILRNIGEPYLGYGLTE